MFHLLRIKLQLKDSDTISEKIIFDSVKEISLYL